MILVFLGGVAVAPFVVGAEFLFIEFFHALPIAGSWQNLLALVFGTVLVEEYAKYLVVRLLILRNREFNEPIDAMLYMIISALGFAAIENVLALLQFTPLSAPSLFGALDLAAIRFLGATFLHALASGIIGYTLALSFWHLSRRHALLLQGFAAAVLLHALFNLFIMQGSVEYVAAIAGILILAGVGVALGLKRLKRLPYGEKILFRKTYRVSPH